MRFVDEVKIFARSGKGGDGVVAFLREKYRPYGGPAGGDGGKGGDVIFVADPNLNTLLDFRYTRNWTAEDGGKGQNKNKSGLNAEDLIIKLPPGTVIYDDDTGEVLHDLLEGDRWIGLPGGKGGRGNQHFATPKNQAPKKFEPGGPAIEKNIRLELKLLADVGLVGYPNAGKSTLLSRVSAARPKIADYPFTTLVPNLGVVRPKTKKGEKGPDRTFVMADIPGLIEGASEGVGLGIRFLRHVERTALFLHVIDFADPEDGGPWERFCKIEKELEAYDAIRASEPDHGDSIAKRPALVAANKMDLPDAQENLKLLRKKFESRGFPVVAISGVTGKGIDELIEALSARIEAARKVRAESAVKPAEEHP